MSEATGARPPGPMNQGEDHACRGVSGGGGGSGSSVYFPTKRESNLRGSSPLNADLTFPAITRSLRERVAIKRMGKCQLSEVNPVTRGRRRPP